MSKKKDSAWEFYLRSLLAIILAVPFAFLAPSVAAFVFLIVLVALNAAPIPKKSTRSGWMPDSYSHLTDIPLHDDHHTD